MKNLNKGQSFLLFILDSKRKKEMSRHFLFWLQTNRKTLNGKLRQIIYHYERNMKSIQQISNRDKKKGGRGGGRTYD